MRQRARLLSGASAMALTLLVALAPPYVAAARNLRDTTTPIIFVHGYSVSWLGSCPGVNAAFWHALQSDLAEDGWLGPKRAVGFCDDSPRSSRELLRRRSPEGSVRAL